MSRFKIINASKKLQHQRLEGDLNVYRKKIIARRLLTKKNKFIDLANELIDEAHKKIKKGNIDAAWKCFQAARQLEIFMLNKSELISEAKSILKESVKLNTWRKSAVENLLNQKVELKKTAVYKAAQIRDEHYNNEAYKNRLFRNYLNTLLLFLTIAVLSIIPYFILVDDFERIIISDNTTLVGVLLFGFFGGVFSAVLKIPPKKVESKIPEQLYRIELSIFRVLVAVGSAIFIYVILQTHFGFAIINGYSIDKAFNPYLIFVISFFAGFSERLVLKAVSLVAKD